jgi:hypothetical protein
MTAPTDPLTRARALLACAGDPGVYSTVPVSIDTLALLCDELEKAREVVEAAREARGPRHRLPHQWMCACSACADDRAADAALPSALARYDAARRGEAG